MKNTIGLGLVLLLSSPAHAFLRVTGQVTWLPATIFLNHYNWIQADSGLTIQTDEKYHKGSWGVEIYTDNTTYKGHQTDKNGLISQDGLERLPILWRITDKPAIFPNIIEKDPNFPACDFTDCAWSYLLDRNDKTFFDGFWYSTPLNFNGSAYAVNSRFRPHVVDGVTTEYLSFASIFRYATRQPYSTTIYVELFSY